MNFKLETMPSRVESADGCKTNEMCLKPKSRKSSKPKGTNKKFTVCRKKYCIKKYSWTNCNTTNCNETTSKQRWRCTSSNSWTQTQGWRSTAWRGTPTKPRFSNCNSSPRCNLQAPTSMSLVPTELLTFTTRKAHRRAVATTCLNLDSRPKVFRWSKCFPTWRRHRSKCAQAFQLQRSKCRCSKWSATGRWSWTGRWSSWTLSKQRRCTWPCATLTRWRSQQVRGWWTWSRQAKCTHIRVLASTQVFTV